MFLSNSSASYRPKSTRAHTYSATLKRNFPVSLEADLPQVLSRSPPLVMRTHSQLAIHASKPTCDQLIFNIQKVSPANSLTEIKRMFIINGSYRYICGPATQIQYFKPIGRDRCTKAVHRKMTSLFIIASH